MKELRKKASSRPLPKIERRTENHVHDDSAHLWAVSYSDFLMVLLCFFIIFFSTDENKKESIIQKIFVDQASLDAKHRGVAGKPEGSTGQETAVGRNDKAGFPQKNLEQTLEEFSLSKSLDADGLLVQFKDNLYEKGSYDVASSQMGILSKFLKKIKPYENQISLTFIGHADGDVVHPGNKKIYRDNFDLSAIRATRALQWAVGEGFPEDQVSAKGNSKNSRVTRSLSVLIKPKGEFL